MEIRQLGGTGVRVSALCLGAMNFREDNSQEGVATIRAALDAGVNFIDTANVYSRGQSETVVGRAISGIRDEVVLATKVHGQMSDSGVNDRGNSRRHIKAQCDASLRRLGADYIDLYQLHRADPTTPIEESLGALDDLIRAGKVHYVGVSTFPAWQTAATLAAAERHHLASAPVCEQPPHNLLDRQIERDILPMGATTAWPSSRGARWRRGSSPASTRVEYRAGRGWRTTPGSPISWSSPGPWRQPSSWPSSPSK